MPFSAANHVDSLSICTVCTFLKPLLLSLKYIFAKGMKAGDNTINYYCVLREWQTIKESGSTLSDEELIKRIFVDYVTFMTTPGSHPDTWVDGNHK